MKFKCSICKYGFDTEWDHLKDGEWECPGCHRVSPPLQFTANLIMEKDKHGVVYDLDDQQLP